MLSMNLRPMLYMTICCAVCRRALSSPSEALDDDRLAAVTQLPERPDTAIVQCPKCGQFTRNKRAIRKIEHLRRENHDT